MAGWFERAFPNPAFAGPARPAVLAGYGQEHGRRGVGRLYGLKIAPTCVGKTGNKRQDGCTNWKHPHMRGEDSCMSSKAESVMETPPHAWGRRVRTSYRGNCVRNTPTCVGKTLWGIGASCFSQKHPHMRGEDVNRSTLLAIRTETPPHAWGRP